MSEDRTSEFFALCQSLPEGGGDGNGAHHEKHRSLHRVPTSLHSNVKHAGHHQEDSNTPSFSASSSSSSLSVPTSVSVGRYGSSTTTTTRTTASASNAGNDSAIYAELRTFHSTASEISRDIATTSAMLSELSQLVRRRAGLFVDDTDRINWLVLKIKSNIEGLNGRLDEAAEAIARQRRKLGKHSQAGQEASNLVGQLKQDFVKATTGFKTVLQQRSDRMKETSDRKREMFGGDEGTLAGRGGGGGGGGGGFGGESSILASGKKPPVYDTPANTLSSSESHGFHRSVSGGIGGGGGGPAGGAAIPKLDLTSGLMMMQQQQAANNTSGLGEGDSIPPGEPSSSAHQLPRPRGVAGEGGGSVYSTPGIRLRHSSSEPLPIYSGSTSSYHGSGKAGAPLTPFDIQRMEQESGQQEMMQLIPDQTYLQERADAMSQVETNIVELGTIFNKLAVMVSEHREMVQRVEDNTADAEENVNLSLARLNDTLTNLRTNKQLFMKIFAVVVVFIILFITFFA